MNRGTFRRPFSIAARSPVSKRLQSPTSEMLLTTRREALKLGALSAAAMALEPWTAYAQVASSGQHSGRPPASERKFTSDSVEETILQVKRSLGGSKLAGLFENCYPNTLDTTVRTGTVDGKPDTF